MANVILDFDGTIADSLPVVISMLKQWYHHLEKVDAAEVERLRNMPIHSVLEDLRIAPWRVPSLVVRGRLEMSKHLDEVKMIKGMPKAIKDMDKAGHSLYVMSTNSSRNIRRFLAKHDLSDYFGKVYGGIGIFGKANALKKIIDDNHLSIEHTFYVGDEIRDIKAAHKAGAPVIAVTWGYNGTKVLKAEKPTHLVSNPADLLKAVSSVN